MPAPLASGRPDRDRCAGGVVIAAPAQATTLDDLVSAVVRVKTFINPDGTSVSNLGREREGSGIVIDESGLVLTIGYLMVEAHAAEIVTNSGRTLPATVVGYDHETGFGLLRTLEPPKIKPLAFGRSADLKEQDPALVVSYGGAGAVLPVRVVEPPRVHRKLGVSGRGRDLHEPAASGLERRGADQPRGQADRRRLADRRRRQRRERAEPRQHVRADRSAAADPRRSAREGPRRRRRAGPGSASTRRRCTGGCWSAASRRAVPAEQAGLQARRHHRRRQRREDPDAVGALSQDLGARRRRRDGAARRAVGQRAAPRRGASRSTGSTRSSCNRRSKRHRDGLHAVQRAAIDVQSAGALRAQCQGPAVRGAQARPARRRSAQAGVSRAQSQRRGADARSRRQRRDRFLRDHRISRRGGAGAGALHAARSGEARGDAFADALHRRDAGRRGSRADLQSRLPAALCGDERCGVHRARRDRSRCARSS